jgi:hypothetical protein
MVLSRLGRPLVDLERDRTEGIFLILASLLAALHYYQSM